MSKRNNETSMWVDKEFKEWLLDIQAKRRLNKNPVKNIAQITKEIYRSNNRKILEQELLDKKRIKMALRIKIDGGFQ